MLSTITRTYFEKQINDYLSVFSTPEDKRELAEMLKDELPILQKRLNKYLVSKQKSIGKNFFQKRIEETTKTIQYINQKIKQFEREV